MSNNNTLTEDLHDYYQRLPYPLRDPEEEKSRLLPTYGEHLEQMSYWLYRGKEDFNPKNGKKFRVLVAGGGTGDAAIFLAEQLKNSSAEVVYLDFSKPSMEIAQRRAEIRKLTNITWINDSLFNIPNLNLGKFDFIDCIGVLHHFPNCQEGLQILSDSLNEQGAIDFLVYAKYGRTAVTQMQQAVKLINKNTNNPYKKLMNTKAILSSLPQTNLFVKTPDFLSDHKTMGDTGIHGMFLQPDDLTFSLPELYEMAKNTGLHVVQFTHEYDRILLKPENFIQDIEVLNEVKRLDKLEQLAICEILVSNMVKHGLYLSKSKDTIARYDDLDNVPYGFRADPSLFKSLADTFEKAQAGVNLTLSFNTAWAKDLPIVIYNGQYTKYIFKYIDGKRTLGEIFGMIKKDLSQSIDDDILIKATEKTLAPLIELGTVLLRDKSVNFPKVKFD